MTPVTNIVPVEELPDAVSLEISIPFMLGSISLAASYGSSFFLVDALRSNGQSATTAGAIISTGTIATILCSLVAGRIADVLGMMRTITLAAAMMAIAMICFASASILTLFAYIGGLFLGGDGQCSTYWRLFKSCVTCELTPVSSMLPCFPDLK
ncbi:hypothetical protein ACE103_10065 [Bradyrhizobium sp. ma5]|uniref:hypothetical protein n=1 Tax=Bradyrhizobium sp. ma5 TaxID=3344828 RepID=UPI0035D42A90